MNLRILLIAMSVAASAAPALAEYPAANGTPVVDAANIIPADREAAMVSQLLQYEKSTGHQLMVSTVPSLEGDSVENYSEGYFRQVKIGSKGRDDGTLFLIVPKEHKMRIQTGYGLRTMLTDAQASDILASDVKPLFKSGDMVGGIEAGVTDIIKATTPLSPQALAMQQREAANAKARSLAFWGSVKDFFMSVLAIFGIGAAGFGAYKVATIPARRRATRELAEKQEAYRLQREAEQAERQRQYAAEAEQERKEQAARDKRERDSEARREKARLAREAEAIRARLNMLNALTPENRQAFLDKEEADRLAEQERIREARAAAAAAAAAAEARRAAEWEAGRPAREAAAAAEEARRERVAEAKRRRDEEEEENRRSSYSSPSWSSDSSSSSSSSSSDSSWSGGGGDSGGGGASSSW